MSPLLLLLIGASLADVPMATFPECGEEDRPDLCPSDLGDDWDLISYTPAESRDTIRPTEADLGSGIHLDRALRTTAGRFDVIIALGDSGFDWTSWELRRKWYLNAGELPVPQDADGVDAADHDYDGNGVFNVDDYVDDPRVDITAGVHGHPDMLEPSDLLAAFSDGVDDDGNGYPDDISGWDFFEDDNDAYHSYADSYGEHGAGVAKEAGAEGEGGGGSIGTCPNCAVLPLRVGDTFITDGTRSAEAIVYATDMGAVAISQAIGAMSSPDTARAAAAWAFDNGTVIVGAAGDENQYHHNFPATLDNALYVKSIRHDTPGWEGAYSYFSTLNCNNYGPRLSLSAPSNACATGATAKITGIVGMVQSAARDAGITLSAGEVTQLLTMNADDIWLSEEERANAKALPSDEGWDAYHGYGRVNVARAVEAVAAGRIPPSVSIDEPKWFDTIDAGQVASVDVQARISARDGAYSWTLELGRGVDPREWEEVASGEEAAAFDGVIHTLDISTLQTFAMEEAPRDETIVERMERVHEPAVTLRLRATDGDGDMGELRKTFHVHRDPDLLPGFPLDLGGSIEASPTLADLDGDGIYEIIVATSSGDLTALHGDGSVVSGWPASTDARDRPWATVAAAYQSGAVPAPREAIMGAPAVGDIDGDGAPDVVVATLEGGIWAFSAGGQLLDGYPYYNLGRDTVLLDTDHTWDQGFMGAPALADADGDGVLDVVAAGLDQRLYVVDGQGRDVGPYPIDVCAPDVCLTGGFRIIASPTIGDVDGDGDLEVVQGTNEGAQGGNRIVTHMIDLTTGQAEPGWPLLSSGLIAEALLLPLIGEGHPASTALADVDGDGDLELFDPIMLGQTDVMQHDQTTLVDLPYLESTYADGSNVGEGPSLVQLTSNPAFGDLDGDGVPDPVTGATSSLWLASLAATFWMDGHHGIAVWSGATGEFLPGWPRQIEDLQFLMAPAIADVSGDGKPEVIHGSAGHLVHAWDGEGVEAEGWPKLTGQWLLGSPAVGDVDGDGYVDVVVTSREGKVWVWSTRGHADQQIQWQSQFHDSRNTGNYETPLPTQEGPDIDTGDVAINPTKDKGCKSCGGNKGSADTGAALLLLPGLLSLAGLRRRR
ncbi:MAG: S8 family serine peptidase [Alphaproteobacteria bacterium]|nr:S8 family serine peptidase [Alphaproteobacteria bacterium]